MRNRGRNDRAGTTHGINKSTAYSLVGIIGSKQVNIGKLQIFEQIGQWQVFINKFHMILKSIIAPLFAPAFPCIFLLPFSQLLDGFFQLSENVTSGLV
jgi:hypothetical protein